MNKKYIEQLQEKNIKVWLLDVYLGVYRYDSIRKRFQGEFGYLDVATVIKCLNGAEEYNHLKIEIEN